MDDFGARTTQISGGHESFNVGRRDTNAFVHHDVLVARCSCGSVVLRVSSGGILLAADGLRGRFLSAIARLFYPSTRRMGGTIVSRGE